MQGRPHIVKPIEPAEALDRDRKRPGKCQAIISFPNLEDALTRDQLDKLLEASFTRHIRKNPELYQLSKRRRPDVGERKRKVESSRYKGSPKANGGPLSERNS